MRRRVEMKKFVVLIFNERSKQQDSIWCSNTNSDKNLMSSNVRRPDGEFPRLESISDCKYEASGSNDNFMAQIGTLDGRDLR